MRTILVFVILASFACTRSVWRPISQIETVLKSDSIYHDASNIQVFELRKSFLNARESVLSDSSGMEEFVMHIPVGEKMLSFKFHEQRLFVNNPETEQRVKSYLGKSLTDASYASLVYSPLSLSARVSTQAGSFMIDQSGTKEKSYFVGYFKSRVELGRPTSFNEYPMERRNTSTLVLPRMAAAPIAATTQVIPVLRTAISATGEFTQFYGGTEAAKLAIEEIIAHVSNIYHIELGLVLELVPDNSRFIFTDPATDPFDSNIYQTIEQNQALLDQQLGDVNYDLGHVFKQGGGGLAGGFAGETGTKGKGASGIQPHFNLHFTVDYVAHEIGHQLGANHIFNADCGQGGFRWGTTACEPGSGSTIMSYAGVCDPDNIQENNDSYFHTVNYTEISNRIASVTGWKTISERNTRPTVTVRHNNGLVIPMQTPFKLIASGSDGDGDPLTYCWEQIDVDPSAPLGVSQQNNKSPLFRSYTPSTEPYRCFPQEEDLRNGSLSPGELLPQHDRQMTFSVTVRDNRGGVAFSDFAFGVTTSAGPFEVAVPSSYVLMQKTTRNTIRWNVNNTNKPPVNCSHVNILLSRDGGKTYTLLSGNTPNDGSETVLIPGPASRRARIKIEAVNNIFFDISDVDFEIR